MLIYFIDVTGFRDVWERGRSMLALYLLNGGSVVRRGERRSLSVEIATASVFAASASPRRIEHRIRSPHLHWSMRHPRNGECVGTALKRRAGILGAGSRRAGSAPRRRIAVADEGRAGHITPARSRERVKTPSGGGLAGGVMRTVAREGMSFPLVPSAQSRHA